MSTTPEMYYSFFVRENYDDLVRSPACLRAAFNAAVSAFHMGDVLYKYWERRYPARLAQWPTRKLFLIDLKKREPSLRIVQSVATIYKHMYVAEAHLDGSSPQSIDGIVSRSGLTVESAWPYSGNPSVSLRTKDGSRASVNLALQQVVEVLWPSLLREYDSSPAPVSDCQGYN